MQKKLTISINEKVYDGLYKKIGRRRISNFIENLVRPHVIEEKWESGYEDMAKDELREKQALEWSEALLGDVKDDPR